MGHVTVLVRDATGSKRWTVQLPDHIPIKRLLPTMITKLELPTQEADGRLVSYRLHHKQSGKFLGEDDTLSAAQVEENDTLQLVVHVVAGAGNPRLRRLNADWQRVQKLDRSSDLIHVESTRGSPPESYLIRYNCRGIMKLARGSREPIYTDRHIIRIDLPAEYPFSQHGNTPLARYQKPEGWHPNIYQDGTFCYGAWNVGQSLDELLLEIGAIIQYKNYSTTDFANYEAAQWADKNRHLFPVDSRPLMRGRADGDSDVIVIRDDGANDFDVVLVGRQ